jgi:carbonic anhydrase
MTNNVANLVAKYEWSFQGECGPQTWSKEAKKKIGNYQSPINIETAKAEFDPLLELDQSGLEVLYGTHSCAEIQNTGHSFQVNGFPDNKSS